MLWLPGRRKRVRRCPYIAAAFPTPGCFSRTNERFEPGPTAPATASKYSLSPQMDWPHAAGLARGGVDLDHLFAEQSFPAGIIDY
jgi:hypothetical protein